MVYGADYDHYNTVADTPWCVPFWFLQTLRLLMALALSLGFGLYAYLYFKKAFELLNFWALFSSMVAMWLLFITSGQQMVYQKMLERPNCAKRFDGLVYEDLKQRPTGWTVAVFLYAQAFAISAVGCFTYLMPTLGTRQENADFVAIYYKHLVDPGATDWRDTVSDLGSFLPITCLCIDMLLNKIRIPLRQIAINIMLILFFFVICYIS